MVITNVMVSILYTIGSFVIGALIYYIFAELPGDQKRKNLQEMISTLINFVLFTWVSKVILNFPQFINEPLTILAYPASANTFYMAFIFTSALFVYQHIKNKKDQTDYLETFSMVFLITSIVYELIHFIRDGNESSLGYLLLLSLLLVLFLILQQKLKTRILMIMLITILSAGMLVLAIIFPFMTVFGYIIRPWFAVFFLLISNVIICFTAGKEDHS